MTPSLLDDTTRALSRGRATGAAANATVATAAQKWTPYATAHGPQPGRIPYPPNGGLIFAPCLPVRHPTSARPDRASRVASRGVAADAVSLLSEDLRGAGARRVTGSADC